MAPASRLTRFRMGDSSSRGYSISVFKQHPRSVPRRLEVRLEHRDAVQFVAASGGERAPRHRGLPEMFELGALGADFGKSRELRPAVQVQVLPVDGADLELPGVQVLDVADLGPAARAEDLQAPGLGRGDHGSEIAGGAVPEAEQHRGRVVEAEIPDGARALRVHRLDSPRKADHGIDEVHAPPGHAARGSFLAALAPVLALEAVNARAAEIALHVQEFPEPPDV